MTTPRTDLLLRQLDTTWALFEHHAVGLVDALCLWTPEPYHWTVRPDEQGVGRRLPGAGARPGAGADHRMGHLAHRLLVDGH
ncbi:hypothetical protein GCM10022384_00450 [Streptomyces marokkonensis]|uniref:Uncharacterized protein n=1 Tax=Streptomyces marokkonensis TaxID=324855 RepID=A0ABP7NMY9_9ACTN